MVEYRLKDELRNLVICLYNPFGSTPEEQFTTSRLADFIQDCYWQLAHGEQIRRIAFHVTPSAVDAQRVSDDLKRLLQEQRKERQQMTDNGTVNRSSWGYNGTTKLVTPWGK